MTISITTLCENTVPLSGRELIGEHGLSFFIESGDCRILFDAGQGLGLRKNAATLGIDLTSVDQVVLSHGHYDHSGGLNALFDENRHTTITAHPDALEDKLARTRTGYRYIGMAPDIRNRLDRDATLRLESSSVTIAPGIMTTGEVPLRTDFEAVNPEFFVRRRGREIPDPMADDQALIVETEKGLVILLGCSHRGVINTLLHATALVPGKPVHAVMGGLHLGRASDSRLRAVADSLKQFDIETIIVGHCTGARAIHYLACEFPGRVHTNTVGRILKC